MQAVALSPGDVTKIGVGIIIALVVIGALLSLIITHIIGRLIILVVVVALGIAVWLQRTNVHDDIDAHKCDLSTTFFGVHIDAPQSVKQACRTHT
jgi:hypothetical protein